MNLPARIASDERGAALTIVAVALVAMILTVALVLDVANWKVHKRHLQLQADAAALAAAGSFSLGASCSDTLLAAQAHNYGGPDANNALALYNKQVGGTAASKMHILINSSGYFGDAGAGDNTDTNGSPCTAKYIDIKATETDLPWFMGFGGVVSRINAHARVSVVQQSSSNSTLPIAVPNPKPTAAGAIFIDEANGSILGSVPLGDVGVSGDLQMFGSAPGTHATVQVATHTGVVIALSGRPAASFSLAGTLAQICQQQLTDCYDASADPPAQGLSYIRGFDPNASGAQPNHPKLRTVELLAGACSNSAYFSNNTTGCVYDIYARIDKGNLPNADAIFRANGAQLFSSSDPACDTFLNQGGVGTCWHAQLTLPAGSGPNNIKMTWEETSGCIDACRVPQDQCRTGGGNKCKGDFENGVTVQRSYSARDADTGFRSGPIKIVKVFRCDADPTCAEPDHQSFPVDSTHTFAVSIGIAGQLRNATSVSDPLVALRIKSNTGQSLNCDPAYTNLKDELAQGCRPTYTPNDGSVDCSDLGKTELWALPQPWPCVAVNTGRAVNDVPEGLNRRVFGDRQPPPSACAGLSLGDLRYNNWLNFRADDPVGDGTYGFPQGDPRILDAYLTTYGAFSHVDGASGSVPVTGFGHFYVTGWTGQGNGFDPPCQGNGDDPVPNDDSGLIVGHFIFYLNKVGGDGTAPCDPSSINACVIVMTK